jgi:hypothetical protein
VGGNLQFVSLFVFRYLQKKTCFPLVILGGPMVVPDSSPRASAVVSVRNPQRLMLADGTLFPLAAVLFHGGALAHPWV